MVANPRSPNAVRPALNLGWTTLDIALLRAMAILCNWASFGFSLNHFSPGVHMEVLLLVCDL